MLPGLPRAAQDLGEGAGRARHYLSDQWRSNGSLQEAWIGGVSTRRVDELVQAMGLGGMGAGVKTLYEVTPMEGLKDRIGDRAELLYAKGYEPVVFNFADMFREKTNEQLEAEAREQKAIAEKLTEEAVEVASKADVVLFVGGNNRAVETEGRDRANMKLPSGQDDLMQAIARVNPNIVTVLVSGAPNDLNVVQPASRALLISWFNGTEGGNALADVLLGNISPSGRLPFTLPMKLEDSPAYALGNYPQGEKGTDVFAGLVSGDKSESESEGESEGRSSDGKPNTDPNTAVLHPMLVTGSVVAARTAWWLTVSSATASAASPAPGTIHHDTSAR